MLRAYLDAGIRAVASDLGALDAKTLADMIGALDTLRASHGEEAVFRSGERAANTTAHALHFYLLNTDSVPEAFARLEDLQRRVHPRRSVRVVSATDRDVRVEHVAEDGGPAPRAGSLFGIGLAVGALKILGCREIEVTLPLLGHPLVDGALFAPPPPGPGAHVWQLGWGAFRPADPLPSMDDWLRTQLPPLPGDTVALVRHHVAREPARPWTISRMAVSLGTSVRALQRRLGASSTTFSEILWRERERIAAELLQDPDLSIGQVAERTGFADASHLARRFREVHGVTPGRWRERS